MVEAWVAPGLRSDWPHTDIRKNLQIRIEAFRSDARAADEVIDLRS
jgi:hypothetical protein